MSGSAAALSALALAAAPPAPSHAGPSMRELEGFATAVCLIQAGDAYLKDQGYRWSAILVQGGDMPLGRLAPLQAAVKARVAQGGMVVVRDEEAATGSRPLPLVFCSRIVDAPAVRTALRRLAGPRRR